MARTISIVFLFFSMMCLILQFSDALRTYDMCASRSKYRERMTCMGGYRRMPWRCTCPMGERCNYSPQYRKFVCEYSDDAAIDSLRKYFFK